MLEKGRDGEIYNIGGNRSLPNKTVVEQILAITGKPASLIEYVTDRPGHDRRYALSSEKLIAETGWKPANGFRARPGGDGGLVSLQSGVDRSTCGRGEYQTYHDKNYANRNRELREIAT